MADLAKFIGLVLRTEKNINKELASRTEYPFQEYIYPGLFGADLKLDTNERINKVAKNEEERHTRENLYKKWKQKQNKIIADNEKLPEKEEELNKLNVENAELQIVINNSDPAPAESAQKNINENNKKIKNLEETIAKLKKSLEIPFKINKFDPSGGTMDDLYNHFCQPYGDYYQVKNDIEFHAENSAKKDDETRVNPYWYPKNRSQAIKEDAYKKMKFVPKDAIFMTFNILVSGELKWDATRTGDAQAIPKPYFIGPRHILDRIVKIFNVNSEQDERSKVQKLYEILQTIQKITFQNSKKYQKWIDDKPMKNNKPVELRDVCEDLYNRLLRPTEPVAAKAQENNTNQFAMHMGGMRQYTSVMLIGKRTDNPADIENLPYSKKKAAYCWLKNDDGRIIDGGYCNFESRPADVKLIITNGKAETLSDKFEYNGDKTTLKYYFDIYKMQWAGLKLGRLVPGFGLDMYTEKEKDRNDLIRASRGDLGTGWNENWMRQGQGRIDSEFGATTYAFTDGGTRTRKSKRKSKRRKSKRRKSKKH